MDNIVQTLESPALIAALEANLEEEMMDFGRVLAGAEIYNDGEIEGFCTGRAHLNGILRTHLHASDPQYVETKIREVIRYFREKCIEQFGWSVGQDVYPERLERYLTQAGFRKLEDENKGMALDVEMVEIDEARPANLEIHEVEDLVDLQVIKRMEIEGFGSSEEMAQHYYEMYVGTGFGRGTAWRHWSGWCQGEAVAAASMLLYAGVAGIYGVSTIPEARRRGIARAMVSHAIAEARTLGYRIVILSPTELSERIYRRLGFQEYTRIRHYRYEGA